MYSTYMISLIHGLNRGNCVFGRVYDVREAGYILGEFIIKQAPMRESR